MRAYLIPGLMFMLSACSSSVGHNFDTASIQKIQTGKTTRAELINMFGPPDSESPYPEGQRSPHAGYHRRQDTYRANQEWPGVYLHIE